MKYEPVIGIEVHVELNTKTKMFCRCSADYFGKDPNTHTCPVCLGLPGALPYINKEAIDSCIKIGLSLNCSVNKVSYFERKNYFYPDLAKGFQISQLVLPLAIGGWIEVEGDDGKIVKIWINRAHQEEDTGKLTHKGSETLIDFNRSGVPLVEIVTEPDFKDSSQVRDYAKKLQQIFRYLGVSNADMERGDMRLEANVSVRPEGQTELPSYRVELKNINSFRFMVAAIEYEIKRQISAKEAGEKLSQETRGWDENKKCTYLQRSKEEAHDYRYFPEPDLPELRISDNQIDQIEARMPELPAEKTKRYQKDWQIKKIDAQILAGEKELADFFEEVVNLGLKNNISASKVANYIINKRSFSTNKQSFPSLNGEPKKVDLNKLEPKNIIDSIMEESNGLVSDEKELTVLAKQAIGQNQKSAGAYKSGKENAIQVLIGGVMRLSKGKADPGKAREILENLLKN